LASYQFTDELKLVIDIGSI